MRNKYPRILLWILFFAAAAAVSVAAGLWALRLRDPARLADFQEWVASLGLMGWALLFILQLLQVVVAFIPGGALQLAAGAILGAWGGLALCLSGAALATAMVFWLVNRYGQRVVAKLVGEKDLREYKFLREEKRLERLVFILFLIPGTPKDALTYIFALTKIPLKRFLLLSTVARAPAMATSLLAGESITDGNWGRALAMFCVMSVFAGLGMLVSAKLKPGRKR